MRKLSRWTVPFVLTLLLPTLAYAALARTGDASVVFVALGPAGLKIEGKTSDLDLSERDGKVTVSVPLANLDTGIALRNKHMREKYLEVAKFPRAELMVDKASLKVPSEGAEATGTTTGSMTIHGQSKPVTFQYTARLSNGTYSVTGSTHLNIKDFGIDVPSYLGVTVKPDIDVSVRFSALDR
jgi:polyisoprenoid-binding protein YceI